MPDGVETLLKPIPPIEVGIGECNSFKRSSGSDPGTKSIVIVPIRFMPNEDGSVGVAYACSKGEYCYESFCKYARRSKRSE